MFNFNRNFMRYLIFMLLCCIQLQARAQFKGEVFDELKVKNYFKARELFLQDRNRYSETEKAFIEACLANAFNQSTTANSIVSQLLNRTEPLHDTLLLKLYLLQADNYIKTFEYGRAAQSYDYILKHLSRHLTVKDREDHENSYKLWWAVREQPRQSIVRGSGMRQQMKIDKAGLKNLSIHTDTDSMDFIFDTGANISTVTRSTAQRLHMKIIPAGVEIGSSTGQKTKADLAICPKLQLGNIHIYNALFLVLDDEALYFQPIDYRIHGILGFPIINALQEIQITKDNYFIIPEQPTHIAQASNMALDGLMPLILLDGLHYAFDSGATTSMLYHTYFEKYKNDIVGHFPQTKFTFGGAGGLSLQATASAAASPFWTNKHISTHLTL